MVTLVEEAAWTADALVTPGRLRLVEALPFLRHLPAWFPGAEFKRAATKMHQVVQAMLNVPYEFTKRELVTSSLSVNSQSNHKFNLGSFVTVRQARNPDLPPNFVAEYLLQQNRDPEAEYTIKWVAASIYVGSCLRYHKAIMMYCMSLTSIVYV